MALAVDKGLSLQISPVKGNDVAYFLALQPDGRLIAAGSAYNGTDHDKK